MWHLCIAQSVMFHYTQLFFLFASNKHFRIVTLFMHTQQYHNQYCLYNMSVKHSEYNFPIKKSMTNRCVYDDVVWSVGHSQCQDFQQRVYRQYWSLMKETHSVYSWFNSALKSPHLKKHFHCFIGAHYWLRDILQKKTNNTSWMEQDWRGENCGYNKKHGWSNSQVLEDMLCPRWTRVSSTSPVTSYPPIFIQGPSTSLFWFELGTVLDNGHIDVHR